MEKESIIKVIQEYYPSSYTKYIDAPSVKSLSSYLLEDEIVSAVLFYKAGFWKGSLWATNQRLLSIGTSLFGNNTTDISYEKITSMTLLANIYPMIQISRSDSGFLTLVYEEESAANKFISHVRSLLSNRKQTNPINSLPLSRENSIITQLKELAELKEKGYISDDEYASAKKNLLNF